MGTTTARTPIPVAVDDEHRSRAGLWWVLGILVLLLIVAGAFFMDRMFESPPEQTQVPKLTGLTLDEALLTIIEADLERGEVSYKPSDSVRENHVISQDPNADQYVDPGSQIELVVSTGKPLVAVPPVVGQLRGDASAQLRAEGLKPVLEERDSDEDRNQVLETVPVAGQEVPEGSTVTVYYSDGQEKIPDVIGDLQDVAEQKIRAAGFVPVVREDAASVEPAGTVVDQFPTSGQTADAESEVIIFVSTYVEPTPEPTPDPTPADPTPTPTDPGPTLPTVVPSREASPSGVVSPAARRS